MRLHMRRCDHRRGRRARGRERTSGGRAQQQERQGGAQALRSADHQAQGGEDRHRLRAADRDG